MTIEEARTALQNMKSHYQGGFSYSEQRTLEELHLRVLGKPIIRTGCQDCYRDAFIILTNKLKQMENLPPEKKYKLKAGVVLRRFGTNDLYFGEMEDAPAEEWLAEHPQDIAKFQKYPDDWQKRVESRVAGVPAPAEELPADNASAQQAQKKAAKSRRRKK